MPPPGGNRTALQPYQVNYAFGGGTGLQNGPFAPGTPVSPIHGDQPTRFFDFAVGANLQYQPRTSEPFGFAQLRAFANVELIRLAIETRKDQVSRHQWSVKVKNQKRGQAKDERAANIEAFLRKPDGRLKFHDWLRILVEDMLVIDAASIERRRSYSGALVGLDIVPGDTIKILVDATGRPPLPPAAAYQQVVKGLVWNDLTSDDLIYAPRNGRANHLYGFSAVEQVIVTAATAMRRQTRQLSYFTEGNVPPGILNAPDGWTPDQIKAWQGWFDIKLSGQDAARSKLLWTPAGTKYQNFVDPPIKDEFDEWLARIVAYAFSLPPTPYIKALNRASADESGDRALEEGLMPVLMWIKEILDDVIQVDLGFPDMEFSWGKSTDLDPLKQAQIDDIYLKNGTYSVNEVRDSQGRSDIPGGEINRVYGMAAVPVGTVAALPPAPERKIADAAGGLPAITAKLAKSRDLPPIDAARPLARRAAASATGNLLMAFAATGRAVAKQVRAALTAVAKADGDGGDNEDLPARISAQVDLSGLSTLADSLGIDLSEVAADSAVAALAQIGPDAADLLVNQVNQRAVKWATGRAAEMVGKRVLADGALVDSANAAMRIDEATREIVRQTLASGLAENIGTDAIIDNIADAGFGFERAGLIARTEIARANSMGSLNGYQGAQEIGVKVRKKWLLGPNPCPVCKANAEQGAISLDEDFQSGDATPPGHPRCECAVCPVVDE